MKNEDKGIYKNNKFVRILVVVYLCFLFSLVYYNFFKGNSPYMFTTGLITVLLIITIVIFSEVFDSLSLGKMFSLSREVNEKEKTIEEVKQENIILRENVISLANVVSQKQTNHTYIGFDNEVIKSLSVVKSDKNDEEDDGHSQSQDNVTDSLDKSSGAYTIQNDKDEIYSINFTEKIQKIALERFLLNQNIPLYDVITNVKFSSGVEETDPISNESARYDAHYKLPDKETFMSIQNSERLGLLTFYRTYKSLAQLKFYEELKKIRVEMVMLVIDYPEEYLKRGRENQENMLNRFILKLQPAISNHLLKIEVIEFSKEEIEALLEEEKNKE